MISDYVAIIKPFVAAALPIGTPCEKSHDDRVTLKGSVNLTVRIIPAVSRPRPLTRIAHNWGFKYGIVVSKIAPTDPDVDVLIALCEDIALRLMGKDFGSGLVWEDVAVAECFVRDSLNEARLFIGVVELTCKKMVGT